MSAALEKMTQEQTPYTRWSKPVQWYRTPLPPEVLKRLHERSDWLGALQTLGYLGAWALSGGLAVYSIGHWPWWTTVLLVLVHGMQSAFFINAVHELGHGTVFKTKPLNVFFEHLFAFFGWINHYMFDTSHVRHHQFTLHPPDDQEVVLPYQFYLKNVLKFGLVNPLHVKWILANSWRIARGRFCGEWEEALFPASDPAKRRAPVRWARFLLAGHGAILVGSLLAAWLVDPRFLLLPVVISFGGVFGQGLFMLLNNTQHIGLQDNVPDFRLCCRTILINPLFQFWYWHMNYHIEHHMYAAVPCYKLGQLHKAIRHDLAPPPRGIIATWKEIIAIQKRQAQDPSYQYAQPCPNPRPKDIDQRRPGGLQPAAA
jgi:fatty acid desaturase